MHDLQFVFATSFKSAGVVENIAFVTFEHEFVLDVVLATLQAGSSRSAVTDDNGMPNLCCWNELNLLDDEINKSAIRNANAPAGEFPMDHARACTSLDSR